MIVLLGKETRLAIDAALHDVLRGSIPNIDWICFGFDLYRRVCPRGQITFFKSGFLLNSIVLPLHERIVRLLLLGAAHGIQLRQKYDFVFVQFPILPGSVIQTLAQLNNPGLNAVKFSSELIAII